MRWIIILLAVLGLIGVRIFEDQLFYDPFLVYFKQKNLKPDFPDFDWFRLVVSHLFRFVLNLVFSLIIIHFLFLKSKWTKQSLVLIILIFFFFFGVYLFCIYQEFRGGDFQAFLVRRMVIQPVVVLLLVPLYYHRKKMNLD